MSEEKKMKEAMTTENNEEVTFDVGQQDCTGVDEEKGMVDDRMVLCAANNYTMKYFFNKNFDKIPSATKEELRVISVLFAQEVGGIFKIVFEKDGEISIETEADEEDVLYDDIASGLMVKEILKNRQEMFEELELFYRAFVLKEDMSKYLADED